MDRELFEHIITTSGCGMRIPSPLSKEHTKMRALIQRAYDMGLQHGMDSQEQLQKQVDTLQRGSNK